MPNTTIKDKAASLSEKVKKQLIDGAYNGESITTMSEKFNIDYHVIQHLLWQSGTLPWQGANKRFPVLRRGHWPAGLVNHQRTGPH